MVEGSVKIASVGGILIFAMMRFLVSCHSVAWSSSVSAVMVHSLYLLISIFVGLTERLYQITPVITVLLTDTDFD